MSNWVIGFFFLQNKSVYISMSNAKFYLCLLWWIWCVVEKSAFITWLFYYFYKNADFVDSVVLCIGSSSTSFVRGFIKLNKIFQSYNLVPFRSVKYQYPRGYWNFAERNGTICYHYMRNSDKFHASASIQTIFSFDITLIKSLFINIFKAPNTV